jgi:hypothetical protein
MGPRRGRQLRPRAQGRRHRPDQGRRAGECGVAIVQHLLPGAPDEVRQARRPGRPWRSIGVVWPNQASWGTTSTSRAAACSRRAPQGSRGQVPRIPGLGRGPGLLRQRQQRMAGGGRREDLQPGARQAGQVQGRHPAGDLARQQRSAAAGRPRRSPARQSTPRPGARRKPACKPGWPAYRS